MADRAKDWLAQAKRDLNHAVHACEDSDFEWSSHSAKVVFADKPKVLSQLKDYAARLRRSRPEVQRVSLFGSYATDTFGPASDVDLLIILRQSSKHFLDRIPDYLPENLAICCDVFPYAEEEIKKMQREGNLWIRHILKEAISL